MTDTLYCAICRNPVDKSSHVEIEAVTISEGAEYERYLFHLSCWDSVSAGWGRP